MKEQKKWITIHEGLWGGGGDTDYAGKIIPKVLASRDEWEWRWGDKKEEELSTFTFIQKSESRNGKLDKHHEVTRSRDGPHSVPPPLFDFEDPTLFKQF